MSTKAVLSFYVAAFVVQTISAQCIGTGYNGLALEAAAPWETPLAASAYGPAAAWNAPLAAEIGTGLRAGDLAASNGRSFAVTSASPIAPNGISMTSENAYEGLVAVSGALPFLGAIALEGNLPTAGTGAVTYGCGNGEVAILNEDVGAYNGLAGPLNYRADAAGPIGYNGYAGPMAFEPAAAGPAYGFNGIARNTARGCGAY